MATESKIIFDPVTRRIKFDGDCDEVLDICRAMCCRSWTVALSQEEIQSGRFDHETLCNTDGKECTSPNASCPYRQHVLRRTGEKDCLYLDSANKCSIYDFRPLVCREFSCRDGWIISDVVRDSRRHQESPAEERIDFDPLRKMVFAQNPLNSVKTFFYSATRSELVVIIESQNKCRESVFKVHLSVSGPGDDAFLFILRSFDGKACLDEVYEKIARVPDFELSGGDFAKIAMAFFHGGLIIFCHEENPLGRRRSVKRAWPDQGELPKGGK